MKDKKENLHSNMVRFIIKKIFQKFRKITKIYIPIWLDLLCSKRLPSMLGVTDLHSNMVRFIMKKLTNLL